MGWLSLSGQASLTLADLAHPAAPAVAAALRLGGAKAPVEGSPLPALAAAFASASGPSLALELPLQGQEAPLGLSLVPFFGVENFSADSLWLLFEQAVLAQPSVATWLETPLHKPSDGSRPAALLSTWGLLQKSSDGSWRFPRAAGGDHIDVGALTDLRPLPLLHALLDALAPAQGEIGLVDLGAKGRLSAVRDQAVSP